MDINLLFWNSSIDDMKRGYVHDKEKEAYVCLVCGEMFEEGLIYQIGEKFVTPEKRIQLHIQVDHEGMFNYLMSLDKKYTGLTESQTQVLECFFKGMSDRETARSLTLTESTVRNYRFKLREREKQAKVFLSIMELLASRSVHGAPEEPLTVHRGSSVLDEKFGITEKERKEVLTKYFDGSGMLINFPGKEKRKVIILTEIATRFKQGTEYSEKDVNGILEKIYHDYVMIRRYLVDYGFMDRSADGSRYWMREQ
ncbi:LuxR family transcriptional regulator (plasmid) [Peptoclostridium acidaminophilum DSM 3953]|uniref:LuxR family transcriptional regulator n=1 Tax=Peptoclostridium acidaminophilum DSM 3953 TaxID=1286171 RepID=W8T9B1_PEPAC|nr:DUF2087 domain-containing protein [Peptoclostridium acidaminophilum]AHM58249.1 LuxR family transcriptional regulator [Peptoclostridium acidaminophilum DSM 3953]